MRLGGKNVCPTMKITADGDSVHPGIFASNGYFLQKAYSFKTQTENSDSNSDSNSISDSDSKVQGLRLLCAHTPGPRISKMAVYDISKKVKTVDGTVSYEGCNLAFKISIAMP